MLLQINNLRVSYMSDGCAVEVVRGVDLNIDKGECVALVGESGCGKTSVGLSITRLIPKAVANITSGSVLFRGQDLLKLDRDELRPFRGRKISYVFQEPSSSLDPVFTVHEQLKESLLCAGQKEGRIYELLESVGLKSIAGNKKIYPHELSGGMQQRVMIAMAISSAPDLVIMDEPTTALDVRVQRQILELVMELKKRMELAIMFISHDLKVVCGMADRVAVMYAGKIAEESAGGNIILRPFHPYTAGLVGSMPSIGHRKKMFDAIEGKAPIFSALPEGCKFCPRCKFRINRCVEKEPALLPILPGRFSACLRARELYANGIIKDK